MYGLSVSLGHSDVTVSAWTPEDANRYGFSNWSLKPIQTRDDATRHHALANGLRAAISSMGARRAYAPNVAMASATIISADELKKRILLGNIELYRDKEVPADGVSLRPGDAFVMSTAGCPIIIATAGEHVIVAHAGRDSLIERNAVLGKPSRQHMSIVYAVIEEFLKRGESLNRIAMCMLFSIPTELFDHHPRHPEHGAYNRALVTMVDTLWHGSTVRKDENVFLDMESVFVNQAREMGVRCAWATHSLRNFPSLAHTRDGKDPSRRNLFVVKRNA